MKTACSLHTPSSRPRPPVVHHRVVSNGVSGWYTEADRGSDKRTDTDLGGGGGGGGESKGRTGGGGGVMGAGAGEGRDKDRE